MSKQDEHVNGVEEGRVIDGGGREGAVARFSETGQHVKSDSPSAEAGSDRTVSSIVSVGADDEIKDNRASQQSLNDHPSHLNVADHADQLNQQHEPNKVNQPHQSDQAATDAEKAVHPHHTRRFFPGWLYGILFVLFDILAVLFLQKGVSQSRTRVTLSSPLEGVGAIVTKMWTKGNFVFLLNLIILGLIYFMLLMLVNRFWIVSAVFLSIAAAIALVEHFKVSLRYEAILPADIKTFGSNTGDVLSFLPTGSFWLLAGVCFFIVVCLALFVFVDRRDGRHGRMIRGSRVSLVYAGRLLLLVVAMMVLGVFAAKVGTVGSWADSFSKAMGDTPSMWDSVYDAQRNGPAVSFIRQLNPNVMDEPAGYNRTTMQRVAKRYKAEAKTINWSRTTNLNDSTVVYILSESLSDPEHVPGVELNKDPMPNIKSVMGSTTSGLMLSSGYGGGTANLEYMSLTGLSMANFALSLTSPYQQLVPNQKWTPTVNQLWGSSHNQIAFHPYEPSMYSRASNYKKFGFSRFYTLEKPDVIAHRDKLGSSPYVSDESAYQSVFDEISSNEDNQFIQLATMQNHMPYHSWYNSNEFKATNSPNSTPLQQDEAVSIDTYAKGAEFTDKATKKFLARLDTLSKPVTVVFYGDHLPGIYSTASADASNSLNLHLTDYFIWSNKTSVSHGTKNTNSEYTSPNYFTAQTAQHLNARVSPYIAFLTRMHDKISAMEPAVVNKIQGWDSIPEGQPNYLDSKGKPMAAKDFDTETKRLMADYRLIQYDMTAGKGYLKDTGFMDAPEG